MTQTVTIDGHEIETTAPAGAGQTTADVAAASAAAEAFRQVVPHAHFDLVGRDLTAYAANFPDGPVIFNFGDGTGELTADSAAAQATATHTYAHDGTYTLSVRDKTDRWATEVPVNWPPPYPTPPVP